MSSVFLIFILMRFFFRFSTGGESGYLDDAQKIAEGVYNTEEWNVSKVTRRLAKLWTSNYVHFQLPKLTKYAIITRVAPFGQLDNGVM